ncbi:MAG TPA: hypothetical protein GXZ87_03815 [Bacteroidales bacterium]|nr:hypothetical protein [Bacteroidales bacterium]
MRNKLILFAILISSIVFYSCRKISPDPNAGYYKYDVLCINSEMDGSITVKAYGMGKNRKDAVEQAMKNALNTVMFKGVRGGNEGECNLAPLIYSEQVKRQNAKYFATFFSDKSKIYKSFVSTRKDVRFGTARNAMLADTQIVYEVILRVYVDNLRDKLIIDNIIPK